MNLYENLQDFLNKHQKDAEELTIKGQKGSKKTLYQAISDFMIKYKNELIENFITPEMITAINQINIKNKKTVKISSESWYEVLPEWHKEEIARQTISDREESKSRQEAYDDLEYLTAKKSRQKAAVLNLPEKFGELLGEKSSKTLRELFKLKKLLENKLSDPDLPTLFELYERLKEVTNEIEAITTKNKSIDKKLDEELEKLFSEYPSYPSPQKTQIIKEWHTLQDEFQNLLKIKNENVIAAIDAATKSIKFENDKIKEFDNLPLNEKIHEVYFMDRQGSYISEFLDLRAPEESKNSLELANEALALAQSNQLVPQIKKANNLVQKAIDLAGYRKQQVENIQVMYANPKYLKIYTFLDNKEKFYYNKEANKTKSVFIKYKEFKNLDPQIQSAMVKSLQHNISKYQIGANGDEKAAALDVILLELFSNQQRHAEKRGTGLGSFNFEFMQALPDSLKRDLCQRLDLVPGKFTKYQLRDALANEFNPDNSPRSRSP